MECTICTCNVETFGVLNGCFHPFCSPCINRWAQSQNENHYLCPACRQPFTMIADSKTFPSGYIQKERRSLSHGRSLNHCRDVNYIKLLATVTSGHVSAYMHSCAQWERRSYHLMLTMRLPRNLKRMTMNGRR